MAKIKYSALVSDMRNKLNGSVMSKNRYGNYVRNKTTPTNPQTGLQQLQRSRLSAASSGWKNLSQAVRNGFAELAKAHPLTNIFGDQVTLDGKAMFTRLSINRLLINQPVLATVPDLRGVPFVTLGGASFDQTSGDFILTISETTVPVGYSLVVQATPPLSPTINFVKNQYRTLGMFSATAGNVDISSVYYAIFPQASDPSSVGQNVHVRAFLIDTASGEAGIASGGAGVITV